VPPQRRRMREWPARNRRRQIPRWMKLPHLMCR
jgi:hypothetical protein